MPSRETHPTAEQTIRIRHAEPADAEALHDLYSQPRVVWGTLQLPYPSLEMWRKRLAERPEGFFSLVAIVDDRVVSHLGLRTFPSRPRRRHVATLGMCVHDRYQGRGVGTALMAAAVDMADNWLNLERIELEVFVDNEPAIKLYSRFGFVIEGTLRRHAFRDGAYVDSHFMARLKPTAGV